MYYFTFILYDFLRVDKFPWICYTIVNIRNFLNLDGVRKKGRWGVLP